MAREDLYNLPEWGDHARWSYDVFFTDLQDINIYVEDENSEIFYEELIKRFINPDIKITKILPLKGRENVIENCRIYSDTKAALFIIDGDLIWVRGDSINNMPRLYQHDKYCIENYLFSKVALIELIFETLADKPKDVIESNLKWENIEKNILETLMELFIEFATINKVDKSIKTVKVGINDLYTSYSGTDYTVSKEKVEDLINKIRFEIVINNYLNFDNINNEYNQTRQKVIEHIASIDNKLDIVSGKHFLIPLLYKVMKKHAKSNITMSSFYLRLARHCDLSVFNHLKKAIEDTAAGIAYVKT